MPNTFITAEPIARDAVLELDNSLVLGNSIPRDVQDDFTKSSGGQVTVTYVPDETALTQDHKNASPSSLTTSGIVEKEVSVDALHYVYHKKKITTKEAAYELDAFTKKVTRPSVKAIAVQIEQFFANRITGGFARYMYGTVGNAMSAKGDITGARKMLVDQGCPMSNIVALMDSEAEMNMLNLDIFQSSDYQGAGSALQMAQLPKRFGIGPWLLSSEAGTHTQGDIAGTVLLNGAGAVGDTTVSLDGFTEAAPTLYPGTQFTLAGTSTVYTVQEKVVGADNAISDIPISPALTAVEGDGDAATFEDAFVENCFFNPGGVVGAVIAPPPLRSNSAVVKYNGMSVRVSFESTTGDSSGAADYILFDTYVGGRVLRENFGVVVQGSGS